MSRLRTEAERIFREADRLARGGDRAGAIRCYREVLGLEGLEQEEPLTAECAHWGLAELLVQSRDMDRGEAHLREAIRLNPGEAGHRTELGSLYNYQAKFGEAAAELEESLRLRPDHPQTVRLLGWVRFMSGDHAGGRELLERAFKLDDSNTGILNDLAVCLVEDGKLDRALSLVERACAMDPKSPLLRSFREMIIQRRRQKRTKGREPAD
jgi:cytochrome c-type biogenesis protein CcmH/NrfG